MLRASRAHHSASSHSISIKPRNSEMDMWFKCFCREHNLHTSTGWCVFDTNCSYHRRGVRFVASTYSPQRHASPPITSFFCSAVPEESKGGGGRGGTLINTSALWIHSQGMEHLKSSLLHSTDLKNMKRSCHNHTHQSLSLYIEGFWINKELFLRQFGKRVVLWLKPV